MAESDLEYKFRQQFELIKSRVRQADADSYANHLESLPACPDYEGASLTIEQKREDLGLLHLDKMAVELLQLVPDILSPSQYIESLRSGFDVDEIERSLKIGARAELAPSARFRLLFESRFYRWEARAYERAREAERKQTPEDADAKACADSTALTANSSADDRRTAVDAFLVICTELLGTGQKIIRKHIHDVEKCSPRLFQQWQAADPTCSAKRDRRFRAMLNDPAAFVAQFKAL
jgi:hypothetical protein